MNEREALKLALEALKANDLLINGTETNGGLAWCIDGYYSDCFDIDPINEQTERAITAIKEALAQPEQEPMDTPLPCDVTVGHVTIRKGVALRVLITRMKVLYEMATGQVKFYQKGETD